MKIYLSGPMTGIADFNFPLFHKVANRLRELGHVVLNPADNVVDPTKTWADYMKIDIAMLISCEAIAYLPGWEKSRGASLELHIAKELGFSVHNAMELCNGRNTNPHHS